MLDRIWLLGGPMPEDILGEATSLLERLTGSGEFHPGQFETIEELVANRGKVFLVQRTGWGKSAVYFIATSMLRRQGLGPTLVISPLLALMRNQIQHAKRLGLRAETINSSNNDEWPRVEERLGNDDVDLLLIAPERFANQHFQENILAPLGARSGLIVVDEAHCISDWGHDFRPDYRRIKNLLEFLPGNTPIVACTATANDRVVEDVLNQLGENITLRRGPLAREGLSLVAHDLQKQSHRLAWLAEQIPHLEGTGIIYCLTKRDTEDVCEWLNSQGINALSYHGGTPPDERPQIEQELLTNECKVLVATKALGMGFDHPTLSFVIHFQTPGSVIEYYQQVGRAGRQLDTSTGILLQGIEDGDIQSYFRENAFPEEEDIAGVLSALESSDEGLRLGDLQTDINLKRTRLENLLKNLEVDNYVIAEGSPRRWRRSATPYVPKFGHQEAITLQREQEWWQMKDYALPETDCRMKFLQQTLDDPNPPLCGVCDQCRIDEPGHQSWFDASYDHGVAREAAEFQRGKLIEIKPRSRSGIPKNELAEKGLALCNWGDGGWGDDVRRGKQGDHYFSDELVDALAEKFEQWHNRQPVDWVTCVPSLNSTHLVPSFTQRLAERLSFQFIDAVRKVRANAPQKTMQNAQHQRSNVYRAFEIVEGSWREGSVLLVDDIVDSRWTLTEVARLLRRKGNNSVTPVVLANGFSA